MGTSRARTERDWEKEWMMRTTTTWIACAALVACVGCGRSEDSKRTNDGNDADQAARTTADANGTTTSAADQRQQATFQGCVQKGAGMLSNSYLLTMLNEPPGAAGTSGSVTSTGSSVEREQMRVAAQTYRLDPKGDVKLDELVGKQVRVTGTVTRGANLPNGNGAIGSDQDTQRPNRDDRDQQDRSPRISTADLATLEVMTATATGDSCGSVGREIPGTTDGKMAGTDREPRTRR
jgi:hypothetical protein